MVTDILTQQVGVIDDDSSVTLNPLSQINNQASQLNCVFPEHSTPPCVPELPTCRFTCIDGFMPSYDSNPSTCVCSAPFVVCNGRCQENGPCASASESTEKKKRWIIGSGSCSKKGARMGDVRRVWRWSPCMGMCQHCS